MNYSSNQNVFDSVETAAALNEHADAWRAYRKMETRELRATADGNKWGCAEKVRYNRAVAVLLQLGHTAAEVSEIESEVI